jgi:ABC-2 type transport system ATP-binding protein
MGDPPWGVRGLTVRYGGRTALEGVDLWVAPGEVVAVVGGDGAGKSTLLRALAGAVRPAAGRVERPPALEIGYVSPGPGLYRDLTVDENVAFVGRAYGIPRDLLDGRAGPLLERAGLTEARQRLAGNLSGGMRQKLALVLAIVHRPRLLILDEPTTGVDPVSRADLWRTVAGLAAGGTAIIVSTTYLDEAERATRVLVLADGRPLVAGSPEEVVTAIPGAVGTLAERRDPERSWRRGTTWRIWAPDGRLPAGALAAQPDLEDAVVVAELTRRARAASASAAGGDRR